MSRPVLIRLWQLFNRYADRHFCMPLPGFALVDEAGRSLGHLDLLGIDGGRVFAEGWTIADRVALLAAGDDKGTEMRPNLSRADVEKAGIEGAHANTGFRLDRPFQPGAMMLCLWRGESRYVYFLPLPGLRRLRQRRWRLAARFLVALAVSVPSLLRWRLARDPAARAHIKARLGLDGQPHGLALLTPDLFAALPPETPETPITIIMPVYNAFDLLTQALDRVVRHTDLPWHLIVVEDASTDDRVRPFLVDWAAARNAEVADRVTLIENARNLGFIGTVNRAFEVALARGHHVVLLNSDALVPSGWASRLLAPIMADGRVASVTPMSNDAEIFSVPRTCVSTALAPGQAEEIDAVAQRLATGSALAEAPTGVGFCMAINVRYLARVPQFDTVFGRGYGEEVDWCQRVRRQGGRHLGTARLFVEHRGGASFGDAVKRALIATNNARIATRYPDYDAEVQTFLRHDPLAAPRMVLALAHAASGEVAGTGKAPVPVYLAHSLGGGADEYLRRRLQEDAAAGLAPVVLRVGGTRRWTLELHATSGPAQVAETDDFEVIETLLAPFRARHIVYSCGVGDRDPVTLPRLLLRLKRGPLDRVEVLIHDFFPLSPSYTLLDATGRFSGVPAADDTAPVHTLARPQGGRVTLAEWRAAWGELIAAAEAVTVFSQDSFAHLRDAFPQARLRLRPHRMLADLPSIPSPPHPKGGNEVIGILGNIGYQKGAAVAVGLARAFENGAGRKAGAKPGRHRLVLIGNIDPDYALPSSAVLHGSYRIEDIPGLVARYGITRWLIPSIWPETFSFTTHEALATGLPVMCFDLGAQAEAVRAAPRGRVIALPAGADPVAAVLDALGAPGPAPHEVPEPTGHLV